MDYLGMAAFACIWLGGSMLIAVALYLARGWWLEREKRQSHEAIEPVKDKDSSGQHQAVPQHRDEYDGLRESLLLHIEELLRKVDRQ